MQEVQTQPETKGKCCGKNGGHRRGKCGSSHKHEANAATANPLEIFSSVSLAARSTRRSLRKSDASSRTP